MRFLAPVLVVAASILGACGYAPPRDTNTASPRYQADLEACDTASTGAIDKHDAKRGLTWIASPFTRWTRIGEDTGACMVGKGWGRSRACTAEELRQGNRSPSLMVTAAGVRCADPGSASPARPGDTSPPAVGTSPAGGQKRRG